MIARRDRYQINTAPAVIPATIAATMIAPVRPNAATATSIMLSSTAAFSGEIWTMVTVCGSCTVLIIRLKVPAFAAEGRCREASLYLGLMSAERRRGRHLNLKLSLVTAGQWG